MHQAGVPVESGQASMSLLDADQAAELLNVPKSWLYAQARENRVPHVRLRRYVRFEEDELREWWRTQRRGPK